MNTLTITVTLIVCFATACARAQPFNLSGARFALRKNEVNIRPHVVPCHGRAAPLAFCLKRLKSPCEYVFQTPVV